MDFVEARENLVLPIAEACFVVSKHHRWPYSHDIPLICDRGVLLPLYVRYHTKPHAGDLLFCPTGGTMYSEKDLIHATQTLGDHDPGNCMSKWDKTRFMRHALVIR